MLCSSIFASISSNVRRIASGDLQRNQLRTDEWRGLFSPSLRTRQSLVRRFVHEHERRMAFLKLLKPILTTEKGVKIQQRSWFGIYFASTKLRSVRVVTGPKHPGSNNAELLRGQFLTFSLVAGGQLFQPFFVVLIESRMLYFR